MTRIDTAWSDWAARVYGEPRWSRTKARYWASRWTLARCLWCRARSGLELNHLTYVFGRRWAGYTPLWTLVPLCGRCHRLETAWTRRARRMIRWGEHAWVTFGVWAASRAFVLGAAWLGWNAGVGWPW